MQRSYLRIRPSAVGDDSGLVAGSPTFLSKHGLKTSRTSCSEQNGWRRRRGAPAASIASRRRVHHHALRSPPNGQYDLAAGTARFRQRKGLLDILQCEHLFDVCPNLARGDKLANRCKVGRQPARDAHPARPAFRRPGRADACRASAPASPGTRRSETAQSVRARRSRRPPANAG